LPRNIKAENLEAEPGTKKKEVELTRQEIAGMTGLRVETVIRLMTNLVEKQLVDIERGKCSIDAFPISICLFTLFIKQYDEEMVSTGIT
jgi:hypothetical protein